MALHACKKNLEPFLDLCVSSLREGHANLLCIDPILTDVAGATQACPGTSNKKRPRCDTLCVWYVGTLNTPLNCSFQSSNLVPDLKAIPQRPLSLNLAHGKTF